MNKFSYKDGLNLSGRTFVVLGSGQGIGGATVRALSEFGANVVCVDIKKEFAQSIAEEVDGYPIQADCTKRDEFTQIFDQAEAKYGPISGIVDIIGTAHVGPLALMDDKTWDWVFDIVVRHVYLTIQVGGDRLQKAGGGSIVLIGSMSGNWAYPMQAAYGAMKAGVHHLTKSAALELGEYGIRVNSVAPGFTRTPELLGILKEDKQWDLINSVIPLGFSAEPSDIASTVLFLSSDWGRHITGQTIVNDGGQGITAPTVNAFG